MAGAGYKLFNTGDVLTAAQVNTYLQEQAVMRFANATARTTALSGVLSEGMMSYLDDTNSVEVYNGSSWVSVGGSVATSLGFTAGKNKIINGDFGVWQRGTSFTNPASLTYNADRWCIYYDGSVTSVISRQTFTPGTAPVSGYEGSFFWRWAITAYSGGTVGTFFQRIEDVRTFAGQTVTVSFWAKADAARTVTVGGNQNYGSGGSGANGVGSFSTSLTTSWQRFTGQLTIPSIAGKTIGTGSSLELSFQIAQNTVQTIDIWGVQIESGSTVTAFQTATGTIQGELAACQRYCVVIGGDSAYEPVAFGTTGSTTTIAVYRPLAQPMRIVPSLTVNSVSNWNAILLGVAAQVLTGMTISTDSSKTVAVINGTFATNANFGSSKAAAIQAANTTSAQVILSAEL